MGKTIVAVLILGVVLVGGRSGGRIFSRDGKNLGEIRQDRSGGGYSIYDEKSKRLGDGKPSPDGKSIEFYDIKGNRLFQIRKDR